MGKIARLTLAGTLGCLLVSLLIGYLLLLGGLTPFEQIITLAVLLPIVIALPLLVIVGYQRNQLDAVRRKLTRSATYDPLTSCLHGPVFSSLIDRRKTLSPRAKQQGAFIIIHTSGLQKIQRDHGLDWADETLRTIGEIIRRSVRETDMVGRIDPADFGVFLPGATEEDARNVGDRVYRQIAAAWVVRDNDRQSLDVRVAGIVFQHDLLFDEMFRATQDLLPTHSGTNMILSQWPQRPRSQPGWTN
jgi:diguanylate cyclase (GGDEF)-like protein